MKQLILMTMLAAAIVAATLWLSPVMAQTETLPVTWQPVYTVDQTALPPDIVAAYMSNPEGTLAATIQAIDQAQTWIDEQGLPSTLNIRNQIYSHIRSVPIVEAEHYLRSRATERGITPENDPQFWASLDTLKNWSNVP